MQPTQKIARLISSVSHTWFFTWTFRYVLYGLEGRDDLSSAPHHPANQTEDALDTAIVTIRTCREKRDRDETKYALIGAVAIQKELQELGSAPPGVKTRHNMLVRHGFIGPDPQAVSAREVIARHHPVFQMTQPGQVHQLELVGPRYLKGSSQKYSFYPLRDVCSRRDGLEVGKDHKAQAPL